MVVMKPGWKLDGDDSNAPNDGQFTSFSASGRFQVWQPEAGTGLAVKPDGATTHFLGVDVQRGRLAAELFHDVALDAGALNTAVDLDLLTASSDTSLELADRLNWQTEPWLVRLWQRPGAVAGGVRIAVNGDLVAALRYKPQSEGGEGLMMSLEPSHWHHQPATLYRLVVSQCQWRSYLHHL